jgi:DNA-binding transcriptional regulator YhcF (GntR family)
MTDINERVVDEWVESTTARERIKEILKETTIYSKVRAIADRARVSEPTTRKYLNELVEEGIGTTEQDGRTTLYKRNQGRLVDRRIEELRTTCSHQELVEGIQDMKESIAEFRETYDVESPEDLVIELEPGDEGWSDVGQWQSTRRNLAIAKAAIQVDEAHRLAEPEV